MAEAVPEPRVIVIQMGARRGYAVPAAFAAQDRLEALYTDLTGVKGLGRIARRLGNLPLPARLSDPLKRLGNRMPPASAAPMARSFDWVAGRYELAMLRATSPAQRLDARLAFNERWSRAMLAHGFGRATHIYAMMSGLTLEGEAFLLEARSRGLEVVIDMTIALSAESIIAREYAANSGWGVPPATHLGVTGKENPAYRRMLEIGTRFLCPSAYVADDMIRNWGADSARVLIEPYSFNPIWLDVQNRPDLGRVLFAGSADLRKGIHVFARAARILRARGRDYQFRVVGNVDPQVRHHAEAGELDFAGRLPRWAMAEEFARADVLALPTLVEGSAAVTYEAMAAAVPVITTYAAGSLAEDGVHGHIIQPGDANVLADAIDGIVQDRQRRNAMAAEARSRMAALSWSDYGERLVGAVVGRPSEGGGA
jgi:hypothetical protein